MPRCNAPNRGAIRGRTTEASRLGRTNAAAQVRPLEHNRNIYPTQADKPRPFGWRLTERRRETTVVRAWTNIQM
jgi:hypothetical protein